MSAMDTNNGTRQVQFPNEAPTPKQLILLSNLVRENGKSIKFPKNRLEASKAIDKCKKA